MEQGQQVSDPGTAEIRRYFDFFERRSQATHNGGRSKMANASNAAALIRFPSKGGDEAALVPTEAMKVAPPSNSGQHREIRKSNAMIQCVMA